MPEILLTLFFVMSVLDIATTALFPKFGITEGNAWLRRLVSLHGFDVLFLVKYVVFVHVLIAAHQGLIGVWALLVVCAMQAAIVAWNAYQIARRARAKE